MNVLVERVFSLFRPEDVEGKRKELENEALEKCALSVQNQCWFSEISQLKESMKGCVLTAATDREEYNLNRKEIWNLDASGFPWVIFQVNPDYLAEDVTQALAFGKHL